MAEHDPRHVMTVPDRGTAVALAAWLTEKGYLAEAVQTPMTTTTAPLTGEAVLEPGTSEVWVIDPAKAEAAREFITEQAAAIKEVRARQAKRAERTGTTTATCEECGKESEWPAGLMGSTQDCPTCGAYMDIPDPDEQWDDIDFDAGDGEDGEG